MALWGPLCLLTNVFSVYFCDVGHETRDCETRDDWMSRVPRPEVPRQKDTAYESNAKNTHPNDIHHQRDAIRLREPDEADGTGTSLL